VNQASSASAAPSFISKEVAEIFEENHSWITRQPAISVDDQEVVRYFSEYLNNVFRSNVVARYVVPKAREQVLFTRHGLLVMMTS
jgi:hypothetical protein